MNKRTLTTITIAIFLAVGAGYMAIHALWDSGTPSQRTFPRSAGSETEAEIGESGLRLEGYPRDLEKVAHEHADGYSSENDPGDDLPLVSDSRPIQEAFSGEISITEALKSMALEGRIGYDRLVKNLSYWEPLCSAKDSRLNESGRISRTDRTQSEEDILNIFCSDFPSNFSQELDEFLSVHLEETTEGANAWSRRLSSIKDLGADSALESAIGHLKAALEIGNYAEVVDIVSFLGFSRLLEEERIYEDRLVPGGEFADIEVMIAASSSLFCRYLGGCSGQHPVTMSLCLQFRERQCSNPGSIDHAVEQILTGHELDLFYRMRQSIMALLSNAR